MIKQGEISQIANRLGIRDTQVEKDYVIGWVLKGISHNDYLKEHLIFKGGTALRKIYFDDYRLSEDIDFTFDGDNLDTKEVKKGFEELIIWLQEESRIALDIQDEKVYQTGNYNFYFGYTGPLGGAGANKRIKIDIANDEILCDMPVEKDVYNEYSDLNETYKIISYTLSEIIIEKMRSLMQRTMPRDLYDTWYLFEIEGIGIEDFAHDFKKKAEFKDLNPENFVKTVTDKKEIFKRQWEEYLVNQIKDIPDFEDVWRRLARHWRKFDSSL